MFVYAFKVPHKIIMQTVLLFISKDVLFCMELSKTHEI